MKEPVVIRMLRPGRYDGIPGYREQGIDITSMDFTFSAGIHPKTPCSALSAEDRVRLYQSVRGRKDEPSPVYGAKIRRVGVLGYDSFFCPRCQPVSGPPGTRAHPIPWQDRLREPGRAPLRRSSRPAPRNRGGMPVDRRS